jgi:hypothetical protein
MGSGGGGNQSTWQGGNQAATWGGGSWGYSPGAQQGYSVAGYGGNPAYGGMGVPGSGNPYAATPWMPEYASWNANPNSGAFVSSTRILPANTPGFSVPTANHTVMGNPSSWTSLPTYQSPYGSASGYTPKSGWTTNGMPATAPADFGIPSAFKQTNPYGQAASGYVGGKTSGPANPYNNNQFANITKPMNVFDSLKSSWDAIFNTMGMPSMKGAGVGFNPGSKVGKLNTDANNMNTLPVAAPGAVTPEQRMAGVKGLPTTAYSDPSLDAIHSALNNYMQTKGANPNAPIGLVPGIADRSDMEIIAAARYVKGAELIALDQLVQTQGKVVYTDPTTGQPLADANGNIVHAPIINNDTFNRLPPLSPERGYFFDKYNPLAIQGIGEVFTDSYLEAMGTDADSKMRTEYGVWQKVVFGKDMPFNFSYADLLSNTKDNLGNTRSTFAAKLLNEGYNPKTAAMFEQRALQMMYANTPENIRNDPASMYFIGATRGQPGFTITLPGVTQTMPYAAYANYVTNLSNAVKNSGASLTIQGSKYEGGQVVAMMEKMSKGDYQIVPEYNNQGDYTGGLGAMAKQYAVIPVGGEERKGLEGVMGNFSMPDMAISSGLPSADQTSYTNFLLTAPLHPTIASAFNNEAMFNKVQALYTAAADGTDWNTWLAKQDWNALYNKLVMGASKGGTGATTPSSSYTPSYKTPSKRLRSVSY